MKYLKEHKEFINENLIFGEYYMIVSGDEKWYYTKKVKKDWDRENDIVTYEYQFEPIESIDMDRITTAHYHWMHNNPSFSGVFVTYKDWEGMKSGKKSAVAHLEEMKNASKNGSHISLGEKKSGVGTYTVPVHVGEKISFDELKPSVVEYNLMADRKTTINL